MPSVQETGTKALVDPKARPNAKLPEAPKYTDVTRTSSASFKPPMSKDHLLKKKTDVPQSDSSWFTPLVYIKSMFGTKSSSSEPASQLPKNDKNKKVPPVKNTAYVPNAKLNETKETLGDQPFILGEANVPTILPETATPAVFKSDHSPRFSFTADEASGKKSVEKRIVPKKEIEDYEDPRAPKYSALRFVENKSTYLHTPEKKGTTSFRITTSSKVKAKLLPGGSPKIGNKRARRSPTSGRQSSVSPKKIPLNDSGSTTLYPTRLRSKSTPDHSSIKPRLVSDTTCPKSLNLKLCRSKHVQPSQNDVNDNRAALSDVKQSSKQLHCMTPTILDGTKHIPKFPSKKNASQSSKSSLQIGVKFSPSVVPVTRSSSAEMQRTKDSDPSVSKKGLLIAPKPNAQRPSKHGVSTKVQNKEQPLKQNSRLDKATGRKHSPPADSPTIVKLSKASTQRSHTANPEVKDIDPLAKFVMSQQRVKDKLKTRMETPEGNKIKAHHMVLPASVENFGSISSKSGLMVNSESISPGSNIVQRRGRSCTKDISPTIAESPIRRPSPPGVMCLTSQSLGNQQAKHHSEECRQVAIEENDLQPVVSKSLTESTVSSSNIENENTPCPSQFPVNRSNLTEKYISTECFLNMDSPNECVIDCIEAKEMVGESNKETMAQCVESVLSQYVINECSNYTSREFNDKSNSACCYDDRGFNGLDGMETGHFNMDIFTDDIVFDSDTCNSALSWRSIRSSKECMQPSLLVSETEDTQIFESVDGPTVLIDKSDKSIGKLSPFQAKIDKNSVSFFADEQCEVTSTSLSAGKRSNHRNPVEEWEGSIDSTHQIIHSHSGLHSDYVRDSVNVYKDRSPSPAQLLQGNRSPKGILVNNKEPNKGKRRRYPFDIDQTKITASRNTPELQHKARTPIIPRVNETASSSSMHNVTRLHESPFISPNIHKNEKGGNYLKILSKPLDDDVSNDANKTAPVAPGQISPSGNRSSYKHSPDITFSAIASSVGEALNSFADTFKKTFPSKQNPENDSPPKPSQMKPTTMSDNQPLNATMTYISTSLEKKGLSPLPWVRPSKKPVQQTEEVKRQSPKLVLDEVPFRYRKVPDPPTPKPSFEKPKYRKPIKRGGTSEVKYVVPVKKESQSPDREITQPENIPTTVEVKPSDSKQKISLAPVADSMMRAIEDTKTYLSNVLFSPPVRKVEPEHAPNEVSTVKDLGDKTKTKSETEAKTRKEKDHSKSKINTEKDKDYSQSKLKVFPDVSITPPNSSQLISSPTVAPKPPKKKQKKQSATTESVQNPPEPQKNKKSKANPPSPFASELSSSASKSAPTLISSKKIGEKSNKNNIDKSNKNNDEKSNKNNIDKSNKNNAEKSIKNDTEKKNVEKIEESSVKSSKISKKKSPSSQLVSFLTESGELP